MQPKSAVFMKVLINRFHKGSLQSLLGCFPTEEAKEIANVDVPSNDPSIGLKTASEKISSIDYTWFLPSLQKLSKNAQQTVAAAFPEPHSSKLLQALNLPSSAETPSPIVKNFLLLKCYKNLPGASEVLPKQYLPQTPLSLISSMNKRELVEVIDFLGLHDLADELKHVVDQKTLKNVYACLNAKEQQYLKYCIRQKEKVVLPSLGIERWSGNVDKLKSVLQSRGIIRLGKALSGENPDFIWHVAHNLDSNRGQTLLKYYSEKPLTNITPALAQQTLNVINILKKKE